MKSLWSETAQLPKFPALHNDIRTDVLIIGGGMAGLLCARRLQDAGVDYALVEANTIGTGITKNTTAKITSQHGLIYHKLIKKFGTEKSQLYLQANQAALETFAQLCAQTDCNFTRLDSYAYSTDNPSALEAELDALEKLRFSTAMVSTPELPFPTVGAIRFPDQAQFHPAKFLAAITQDLRIFEHTSVRELAPHTAKTDHVTITAKKIIIATHFPILNKHGSYFLKMYQHRSYCLALENTPTVSGMYVDASKTGLSFRTHDGFLILGGGSHRTGKPGGNWDELEAFAAEHYPGATIRYRWATQDCMTLDGIPYIGQYSARTPDLYVATGFNKWGMTSSMVAAEILTDLVRGKETPYATLYSPSRSILHSQLAINAFESLTNLLSFSKKRCPHMGCALKWNPAEHTWDCPCHGSRFEEDGTLIDNPATGDLNS